MNTINLKVGANLSSFDASLAQSINKAERGLANLGRSNGGRPLGTITDDFNQFNKSLQASNARVLAFGASAGLILGVQKAFSSLVRETINVEKSLTDINVILGLNSKSLTKFGNDLFNIARNTGQSFESVAEAAKELSRQGLSATETLNRTQAALILTRQSGLEAEDSVKAITAALNSFQRESLNAFQVISKLANVDANFAVSSKDLANAITRTGSAAEGAGVKFDELIGLVTAAQQTTQRGGAVIAQALNSVFARISRPEVIDQLQELGVQINNSQNGIDKLKALSSALNGATQEQAAMIKDTAGGVRNLNVLSSVLGDLQNKYSLVQRATEESNQATDQAIQRNEELNKTYAALTARTVANIQQVSSQFGKLTIGPGLERILENINLYLEGAISKNSDTAGEILGKGILKGLGQFLGGPGLILVGGAIFKLVTNLAVEAGSAFKTILGINKLQSDTISILQAQPNLINQAISSEKGLLEVTRLVNLELQNRRVVQANLNRVAPLIAAKIGRSSSGSTGSVPNFSPVSDAIAREAQAGVPFSKIRIGSSPSIASPVNPSGLGVYNTQDEPAGLNQGISRAIKEGRNPKTYGVPNFAPQYEKYIPTAFNDPFKRPLGTTGLSEQESQALELGIKKYQQQIRDGSRTFQNLSGALNSLQGEFKLTSETLNKIRTTRFLPILRTKPQISGASRTQLTTTLSQEDPNQILFGAFSGGAQGEFISSPQHSTILPGNKYANLDPGQRRHILALRILQNARSRGVDTNIGKILNDIQGTDRQTISATNPQNFSEFQNYARQYQEPLGPDASLFRYNQYINNLKEKEVRRIARSKASGAQIRNKIFEQVSPDESLRGLQSPELQAAISANRQRLRYGSQIYDEPIGPLKSRGFLSSINNKIQSFGSSPRLQNAAIASSFILPIAGSTIAEAIGDKTPNQRGYGQTFQSLANIGSYGALGASFGGYGAIGGIAAGLVLETPKVVRSFTDKLPDLEREFEKLKERISEANNGFSNIIVTNEQFNKYQKGELKLSPQEYGNLKVAQNQQIDNLATLFPKYATQIRSAARSGNQEEIEKVNRVISFENNKESRENLLGQLRERIKPGIFKSSPTKEDFDRLARFAATQPAENIENTKSLYDYLVEDYKGNKTGGLVGRFGNISSNITEALKNYAPIGSLVQYEENPGNTAVDTNKRLQESVDAEKNINQSTERWIEFLKQFGAVSGRNLSGYIQTIQDIKDPRQRAQAILSQTQRFNFASVIEGAGQPDIDPKKGLKDTSDLLKAFFDLRKNIELFNNNLSIIAESDLAAIHRKLNRDLSGIGISTARNVGNLQAFSPFGAIEAEAQGNLRGQRATIQSQIQALNRQNKLSSDNLPGDIFDSLSALALKESQANKNTSAGQFFSKYQEKLGGALEKIIPGYKTTSVTGSYYDFGKGENVEETTVNDPFKAIESYLRDKNPQKTQQFVEKLNSYRETLFKEAFDKTGKTKDELEEIIRVIDTATTKYTTSTQSNETKIADLKRDLQEAVDKNKDDIEKAKISFISSIIQQNADIIDNVEEYRKALTAIQEKNKNIKGYRGIRANALDISLTNLSTARSRLNEGAIGYRDFRSYVSNSARQEIESTGTISNNTLKDVFKSGFGYNQRDFSKDLLDDIERLRDTFASVKDMSRDAFASIVDGSKNAGDAARQFGITLATNVLNNVARLAFDNLFGNLFSGSGGFGKTIGNLFSSGKANGGLIGYAGGGMVYGGSGMRDDVPAMLSNGAFVIKKSSVNKYGKNMLDSLNYGSGFAGGGINQILRNKFITTGRGEKIKGSFDVDNRLSVIGQTDENNPSNAIKFGEEQKYIGYLKTIENYKIAMRNFESAQIQRLFGAYFSGAINIGAGAIGQFGKLGKNSTAEQYNKAGREFGDPSGGGDYYSYGLNGYSIGKSLGGVIRRYASGGSVDNVPALLTGGEYVMSRESVNRMGVGFMNRLNNGQISPNRYAVGGLVGKDINTVNPLTQESNSGYSQQIVASLLKIVKVNEEIRDINNVKSQKDVLNKNNTQSNSDTRVSAPQVSIIINMASNGAASTQTQSSNTDTEQGKKLKDFAEIMQSVALKTISDQMRNGGLLAKAK